MTTETSQPIDRDSPEKGPEKVELRSHGGSLRSKLVLSLATIFLVFLTVDELVRYHVIKPEFLALEKSDAIQDANRVLAALNAEVEHLNVLTKHWAMRIDSKPKDSDASTLPIPTTRQVEWGPRKQDCAAIVQQDGTWDWISVNGGDHASKNQLAQSDPLRKIVAQCMGANQQAACGMTRVGDQSLVMFATVAIDQANSGQALERRDYLVVSRVVDQEMVAALRRQTQVEFAIQPPRAQNPKQKLVVWEANASMLMVEVQLTGLNGEGLANICIQEPRDITARSSRTTKMARNSFILGSVAALLMLLLLLQRIVIGPLLAIREHSIRVAEQGLDADSLEVISNDEIGQLAGSFDHMVTRLRDTQTQLATASQASGRSQVASTVIHNIGNVLTNVNSLLSTATDRVQGLRVGPLHKLAHRLKQSDENEALIEATPDYLEGLAGSLRSDQAALSQILETLHDNICHIHDVIRDQQQYTKHAVESSVVNIKTILDEAIGCCQARLNEDQVSVNLSEETVAICVQTNRSLLLQTLINIIGNARLAMRENGNRTRTLYIDVKSHAQKVRIEFRDTGCGMSAETLNRVFHAHFTTRESGTGLGLHFCAITLKRLGGSIAASSKGPGLGSTFVVELPVYTKHRADARQTEALPETATRPRS